MDFFKGVKMDKATRRQEGGFLSGGRLHPEAASGSASRITLALRRRACFLEREYGLSYSPLPRGRSEPGSGSAIHVRVQELDDPPSTIGNHSAQVPAS